MFVRNDKRDTPGPLFAVVQESCGDGFLLISSRVSPVRGAKVEGFPSLKEAKMVAHSF